MQTTIKIDCSVRANGHIFLLTSPVGAMTILPSLPPLPRLRRTVADEFRPEFESLQKTRLFGGLDLDISDLVVQKIEALAAELFDIVKNDKSGGVREAAEENLFLQLTEVTKAYLSKTGCPMPVFIIVGGAMQNAIVEIPLNAAMQNASASFLQRYFAEVPLAVRRLRRNEILIDCFAMTQNGVSIRDQAMAAAMVEYTLAQPLDDRRIIYEKIVDGLTDVQIAAKLELANKHVRRILQNATRTSKANVQKWIRRLEADRIEFGGGGDE